MGRSLLPADLQLFLACECHCLEVVVHLSDGELASEKQPPNTEAFPEIPLPGLRFRNQPRRRGYCLKTAMELAAELVDLHKYYDLGAVQVKALRGVSMEIPQGDFLSIMGSSGSGKSTLLNLLGGLDRPTKGKYILRGKDVAQLDDNELSSIRNSLIGFIFQSFNLIPQYTVLENIEVPLLYRPGYPPISAQDRNRVLDVAAKVGLAERLDHRPFQLSGGQQQRVAIARALINDPAIIMADEPTGNLDSKTGDEIMAMLKALNAEGRTIIMVTHEPDVAEQTKRQIFMKDGVIAGHGIFKERLVP